MNRGSGRIVRLGNLSREMKEAIKTADACLKANLRSLGIEHDERMQLAVEAGAKRILIPPPG